MILFAGWAFFSEKKNNIGWSAAIGRLTLFARWAFFSEQKNNIGWSAAYGRMSFFAGRAFLLKRKSYRMERSMWADDSFR